MKNNSKEEGIFAIGAAVIVMFSAMWNPIISVFVSVMAMILYAIYKLRR
jgi:hypothetical protein